MSSRSWMIFSRRSSDAIAFERTCFADSPSNLQSPNLTGIGSASTSWGLSGRGSHRGRPPPAARANDGRRERGHDVARPGACAACTADIRRACSSDPCACGVPSEGWLHDSPPRWSPVGAARVGGLGRRPSARQDALVIALHAVWSRDSQLCVWGEDSDLPARAASSELVDPGWRTRWRAHDRELRLCQRLTEAAVSFPEDCSSCLRSRRSPALRIPVPSGG